MISWGWGPRTGLGPLKEQKEPRAHSLPPPCELAICKPERMSSPELTILAPRFQTSSSQHFKKKKYQLFKPPNLCFFFFFLKPELTKTHGIYKYTYYIIYLMSTYVFSSPDMKNQTLEIIHSIHRTYWEFMDWDPLNILICVDQLIESLSFLY